MERAPRVRVVEVRRDPAGKCSFYLVRKLHVVKLCLKRRKRFRLLENLCIDPLTQ